MMTMPKKDVNEMTVKELQAYCKKNEIKGISKLSKSELVEKVEKLLQSVNSVATNDTNDTNDTDVSSEIQEITITESGMTVLSEDALYKDRTTDIIRTCKVWGNKSRERYHCGHCGSRILNPAGNNFCFNCGWKLEKIKLTEE